jgi:hypothetical protein
MLVVTTPSMHAIALLDALLLAAPLLACIGQPLPPGALLFRS